MSNRAARAEPTTYDARRAQGPSTSQPLTAALLGPAPFEDPMTPQYRLAGMPVPPPSNNQYFPIVMKKGPRPQARLVPTTELKNFHAAMESWEKQNFLFCGKARQVVADWRLKGFVIRLDIFFFFHGTKIYTQDLEIRRFDITNRIKAVEDAVSKVICVDDREFFKVTGEKCETEKADPYCNALLRPWKARAFEQVKAEEGE